MMLDKSGNVCYHGRIERFGSRMRFGVLAVKGWTMST